MERRVSGDLPNRTVWGRRMLLALGHAVHRLHSCPPRLVRAHHLVFRRVGRVGHDHTLAARQIGSEKELIPCRQRRGHKASDKGGRQNIFPHLNSPIPDDR
jgi:hypothetical protein